MTKNMYNAALLSEFGAIVHKSRTEKGYTQEWLSELAGITDVYLRNLECGSCTATWVIWLKLCTILSINVPEFQKKYILPEFSKSKMLEEKYTIYLGQ